MPLPDRLRSRAVLIGTSSYRDEYLPDLPAVTNNLTDLRAVFTHPDAGAFAAEHCTLIENPTDERQVARSLAEIAATADDVLLIYYAGHGVIGAQQHELYLGVATTDLEWPKFSALPFVWVRDALFDSRAKAKVLILDCCFSGRAIDDFMADKESLVLGQISVSGTYTLTATSANTPALAPSEASYSGTRYTAFSGELLALLRDGVPGGPAELDLHLLYRQLQTRMSEKRWPKPRQCGTDNVHGLALGRNPSYLVGQLADQLAATASNVSADPDASVRLLQALLTDRLTEAVLDQLFRSRILVLSTEIDDDVANRTAAQLLQLANADPVADINLYINSPGGLVTASMAIRDTMKFVKPDVATWAVGLASGTAHMLLTAGTPGKRYALPHARILLKRPWAPTDGAATGNSTFAGWIRDIAKITADDTGQSVEQVSLDADRARWFSAQEALDYGFVDKIVAQL